MKDMVLTGVTGFRNKGVEAIVVSTVEQILQRNGAARISVLTPSPEYDSLRNSSNAVNYVEDDFRPENGREFRRIRSRIRGILTQGSAHQSQLVANMTIRNSSMVVACGGDVFSSTYGNLKHHLAPLEYAINLNIPIVFMAHSIGPFDTDQEATAWTEIARQSALIMVRESLTYEYVTEQLGLPESIVHLTADPAFLLPPPAAIQVDRLLRSYGVDPARPAVGLAISQGISRFARIDGRRHADSWRAILRQLLEIKNIQILLIPHVRTASPTNDDMIMATNLTRDFGFDERIRLIGGDHSAAELKGILGACQMVLAERMHAAIAGLASRTSTVVVAYSVKAKGIVSDVLGTGSWREDHLIPVSDIADDSEACCRRVRNAWEKRWDTAERLKEVLPEIERRAAKNFDLVAGVDGSQS